MLSVLFGLVAALGWGVHDVCVRFVVARAGVALSLLMVLAVGLAALLPVALVFGDWSRFGPAPAAIALVAGACYAWASYSLYRAFEIGPVRLVAPVIASYPVLSVAWAAVGGSPITPGQIAATLAIVAGVSAIAVLSDPGGSGHGDRRRGAIGWSLSAMAGFAVTFGVGQQAAQIVGELPAALLSRTAATLCLLVIALTQTQRAPLGLRGAPWRFFLLMGLCDALALSLVQAAGTLPRPEFAAVTSSIFGMVTIILAWAFLKEQMTARQWLAAAVAFTGIGYLAL